MGLATGVMKSGKGTNAGVGVNTDSLILERATIMKYRAGVNTIHGHGCSVGELSVSDGRCRVTRGFFYFHFEQSLPLDLCCKGSEPCMVTFAASPCTGECHPQLFLPPPTLPGTTCSFQYQNAVNSLTAPGIQSVGHRLGFIPFQFTSTGWLVGWLIDRLIGRLNEYWLVSWSFSNTVRNDRHHHHQQQQQQHHAHCREYTQIAIVPSSVTKTARLVRSKRP